MVGRVYNIDNNISRFWADPGEYPEYMLDIFSN